MLKPFDIKIHIIFISKILNFDYHISISPQYLHSPLKLVRVCLLAYRSLPIFFSQPLPVLPDGFCCRYVLSTSDFLYFCRQSP